jgi:transcriptional regulator with XRE-family HTH domain
MCPNKRAPSPQPPGPRNNSPSQKELAQTLAERVRGILARKNLTLYSVAAFTRAKYSGDPRYHIPGNLYFLLRSTGWTPTMRQLYALGEASGYSLADWLTVFGFRLDEIPRAQIALPYLRTALLDSTTYDVRKAIPWFHERSPEMPIPPVAPLSQLLERSGPRLLSSFGPATSDRCVYAKIGLQDALAFPELCPGSIVRVNPRLMPPSSRPKNGEDAKRIFLVEHRGGFCCSRLLFGAKNRITLLPVQLPFSSVDFELGSEARILGVVDLEIRSIQNHRRPTAPSGTLPEVPTDLARLWTPGLLDTAMVAGGPSHLLRSTRLRAGLSLQHASELSRMVAATLHDQRYFTSAGSLSDYEAKEALPRHIHKLFTLSILYSIRFAELLSAFGLRLRENGSATIPDEWMTPGLSDAVEQRQETTIEMAPRQGFLASLLERFVEFPFFLRHSLGPLSGLPEISLHDVFWVGGQSKVMHPSLNGGLFAIVNRRRQKLLPLLRKSHRERPLYLLTRRDGSYVLASCSLEEATIVVHPQAGSFMRPERLRNRIDAEVVGQIVAVVRSLIEPT